MQRSPHNCLSKESCQKCNKHINYSVKKKPCRELSHVESILFNALGWWTRVGSICVWEWPPWASGAPRWLDCLKQLVTYFWWTVPLSPFFKTICVWRWISLQVYATIVHWLCLLMLCVNASMHACTQCDRPLRRGRCEQGTFLALDPEAWWCWSIQTFVSCFILERKTKI